MKKFIKGTFELDQNIIDLKEYEEKHRKAIEKIVSWADTFDIGINMGTADDNSYLIEYKIVGKTKSFCNGLLSELKSMLKDEWKKISVVWQGSGDVLW